MPFEIPGGKIEKINQTFSPPQINEDDPVAAYEKKLNQLESEKPLAKTLDKLNSKDLANKFEEENESNQLKILEKLIDRHVGRATLPGNENVNISACELIRIVEKKQEILEKLNLRYLLKVLTFDISQATVEKIDTEVKKRIEEPKIEIEDLLLIFRKKDVNRGIRNRCLELLIQRGIEKDQFSEDARAGLLRLVEDKSIEYNYKTFIHINWRYSYNYPEFSEKLNMAAMKAGIDEIIQELETRPSLYNYEMLERGLRGVKGAGLDIAEYEMKMDEFKALGYRGEIETWRKYTENMIKDSTMISPESYFDSFKEMIGIARKEGIEVGDYEAMIPELAERVLRVSWGKRLQAFNESHKKINYEALEVIVNEAEEDGVDISEYREKLKDLEKDATEI